VIRFVMAHPERADEHVELSLVAKVEEQKSLVPVHRVELWLGLVTHALDKRRDLLVAALERDEVDVLVLARQPRMKRLVDPDPDRQSPHQADRYVLLERRRCEPARLVEDLRQRPVVTHSATPRCCTRHPSSLIRSP
jgi:hypothetical protein